MGENYRHTFYAAIDLKSFYASVECIERGLDPFTTRLVVADPTRTDGTICLAVSPALKALGFPGRPRLFQAKQKARLLGTDFIIAPPRMAKYLEYSRRIYEIYLRHLAPTDLYPYSIDEIFADISSYLKYPPRTPAAFVTDLIHEVYTETGITATAGIGTNLFLAKVAMDVVAKHTAPDENGVRLAELDEQSFRTQLWPHQPITDIWRIGPGTARTLAKHQMYTLGDVARCSLTREDLLYKLFGVNAELLIDHAWGIEPTTLAAARNYEPTTHSLCNGQVLPRPYSFSETTTIIKEMSEELAMSLLSHRLETDQLVLHISYDPSSPITANTETKINHYGKHVPKSAHGTLRTEFPTSSQRTLSAGFLKLYQQLVNPTYFIRKVSLTAGNLTPESAAIAASTPIQTDLFSDYLKREKEQRRLHELRAREKKLLRAVAKIRTRYGKDALLRGTDFDASATTRLRNHQIGGHNA